jgi:ribosomal protein S18 acetylase RimI-like enzyme
LETVLKGTLVMSFDVRILTHKPVTDAHLAELTELVRILNKDLPPVALEHINAMVDEGHVVLVAETPDGALVGVATLIYFHQLAHGRVAQIHTVAVREECRGKGIGTTLMTRLLGIAKQGGAAHVGLTSNPSRTEAHQLYKRLGFELHDTNAFMLVFK